MSVYFAQTATGSIKIGTTDDFTMETTNGQDDQQ